MRLLGAAEVWVPSVDGDVVFVAWTLVYHYVETHGYGAPESFVASVLVAAERYETWNPESMSNAMIDLVYEEAVPLREQLQALSREAMSSQWYHDFEYVLWDRLGRGHARLGNLELSEQVLAELSARSEAAGGWFRFSDAAANETGEGLAFVDAATWRKAFDEWLERVPSASRPRDR
jgi:hypothetical protein